MGVFFEARVIARPGADRQALLSDLTPKVAVDFKPKQFVIALVLLIFFCALALLAEYAKLTAGTEGLWTVVQLIAPVLLGFLGGEASGSATAAAPEG